MCIVRNQLAISILIRRIAGSRPTDAAHVFAPRSTYGRPLAPALPVLISWVSWDGCGLADLDSDDQS